MTMAKNFKGTLNEDEALKRLKEQEERINNEKKAIKEKINEIEQQLAELRVEEGNQANIHTFNLNTILDNSFDVSTRRKELFRKKRNLEAVYNLPHSVDKDYADAAINYLESVRERIKKSVDESIQNILEAEKEKERAIAAYKQAISDANDTSYESRRIDINISDSSIRQHLQHLGWVYSTDGIINCTDGSINAAIKEIKKNQAGE